MFPSSTRREIRHFHVVVVQRRQRNVQKKRDARAKLLFSLSKPIACSPFSLPSPSSLLKLPISSVKVEVKEQKNAEEAVGETDHTRHTQK